MLAAVLGARLLSGSPTFLLEDLLAHPLQEEAAFWVFLGFALAFAIKTPLFPLHAWLPPSTRKTTLRASPTPSAPFTRWGLRLLPLRHPLGP